MSGNLGYMPPQASAPSKDLDMPQQQNAPQNSYNIYHFKEVQPQQGPSDYQQGPSYPQQGPSNYQQGSSKAQNYNQPQYLGQQNSGNQYQMQPQASSQKNEKNDYALGFPVQSQHSQSVHSQQTYQYQPSMKSQQTYSKQHTFPPYNFGRRPMQIDCPYCGVTSKTKVKPLVGGCTWIWAAALLVLLPPLCCVPFCCPACMDMKHYCRNCKAEVGRSNHH